MLDGVLVIAGLEDDPVRPAGGVGEVPEHIDLVGIGPLWNGDVMLQPGRVDPGRLASWRMMSWTTISSSSPGGVGTEGLWRPGPPPCFKRADRRAGIGFRDRRRPSSPCVRGPRRRLNGHGATQNRLIRVVRPNLGGGTEERIFGIVRLGQGQPHRPRRVSKRTATFTHPGHLVAELGCR